MGESTVERPVDPETVERIVTWLRENYEAIEAACDEKELPKPPPV